MMNHRHTDKLTLKKIKHHYCQAKEKKKEIHMKENPKYSREIKS